MRPTPVELTPALRIDSCPARASRNATLCTSQEVDQPCVIGFFSPRILIPGWLLESATPSETRADRAPRIRASSPLRRLDEPGPETAVGLFPAEPGPALDRAPPLRRTRDRLRRERSPRHQLAARLRHLPDQSRRAEACTPDSGDSPALFLWGPGSVVPSWPAASRASCSERRSSGRCRRARLALLLMLATVGGAIKLGSALRSSSRSPLRSQARPGAGRPRHRSLGRIIRMSSSIRVAGLPHSLATVTIAVAGPAKQPQLQARG